MTTIEETKIDAMTPEDFGVAEWPDFTGLTGTQKLRATYEFILAHPEKHQQSVWIERDGQPEDGWWNEVRYGNTSTICGTTGCLAGWGAAFDGAKVPSVKAILSYYTWYEEVDQQNSTEPMPRDAHDDGEVFYQGDWMPTSLAASTAFELDYKYAHWLFDGSRTVTDMGFGVEAIEAGIRFEEFSDWYVGDRTYDLF